MSYPIISQTDYYARMNFPDDSPPRRTNREIAQEDIRAGAYTKTYKDNSLSVKGLMYSGTWSHSMTGIASSGLLCIYSG